jgi:hypothetical protein
MIAEPAVMHWERCVGWIHAQDYPIDVIPLVQDSDVRRLAGEGMTLIPAIDRSIRTWNNVEMGMSYTLVRLAPGSYDVLLDGVIVASLVRSGHTSNATWTAELLVDVHPRRRPAPFRDTEHTFGSLEEAQTWLGIAEISDAGGQG